MGTILIILLLIFLGVLFYLRWLMLHNPGKLLRMIFRTQAPRSERQSRRRKEGFSSKSADRDQPKRSGRIIPPEYAEDVEFTEYHSFEETTIVSHDSEGNTRVRTETQITDAEWEEIRK